MPSRKPTLRQCSDFLARLLTSSMLRKSEKLFAILVLLLSTGALTEMWLVESDVDMNSGEGSLATQILWAAVYLVVIGLIFTLKAGRFKRAVVANKPLILLLCWAFISVFWSGMRGLTLRRDLALLGTTLFGAYLAIRYTLLEQLKMLGAVLAIIALMSLFCALAFPSIGIMSGFSEGAWRGVFSTKNELGRFMVLAATVFVLIARHTRRKLLLYCLAGLSLILVVLSASTIAVAIGGVLLLFIFTYRFLGRLIARISRPIPWIISGAIVIVWVGTWVTDNFEVILETLGKSPNLTGRTFLWAGALSAIVQRPVLGAGYNAFWAGDGGGFIRAAVKWQAPHAHNGYLDLSLDLGIIGLGLFVLGLVVNFRFARKYSQLARPANLWPLVFVNFMFLYNFTESSILTRNSLLWIIYVSISIAVTRREASLGRPLLLPSPRRVQAGMRAVRFSVRAQS